MPQLNPISAKRLIAILLRLWFKEIRINGSHHFFRNDFGITTSVPVHWNEDVGIWLLKKILRDIWLSVEKFEELR